MFQRQEKLPTKRSEFYKQGLDLLLGKWDESQGIDRDEVTGAIRQEIEATLLLPQKELEDRE